MRSSPCPALLAASAVALAGCGGAPEEVRFQVLGDAARVRFRGDPAGVRLECVGCADPEAGIARAGPEGLSEAVVRGLPGDHEASLTLRAGDEVVAERRLRAAPQALSGNAQLAGEDAVTLLARRPLTVLAPAASAGRQVAAGPVRLVVGPRRGRSLEIRYREEGLEFTRRYSWDAIAENSVRQLLEALGQVPEERSLEALQAADEAARAAQVARADAAVAKVTPWIPELLHGSLSLAYRRLLLRMLQRFQRQAAFARGLGLPGQVPGDTPELPIEPPNGFPPWPEASRRELTLRPRGGIHELEGATEFYLALPFHKLGSRFLSTVKTFRPANAVTGLDATWPLDAPRAGARMAVGIRVGHLVRETQLRLTAEAEGEEPFVLDFWHPSPALVPRPRYSGWVVASFPAEVGPAPGQRVSLELAPLYRQAYKGNEVRGLEVAWMARGER